MMPFIKRNALTLIVLIILLAVVGVFSSRNKALISRITELEHELSEKIDSSYSKLYGDLDSKIDRWDNRIATLKEAGYVETDEFSELSQRIIDATVLIGRTQDIAKLSDTGEARVIKKEIIGSGTGTGFFIRDDGLIATALHVVEPIGNDDIAVRTADGTRHVGRVVKVIRTSDIALIEVDGNGFPSVELGYFDNFDAGEEIGFSGFALNAGVIKPLINRGVVSAKGTSGNGVRLFLVNAFINPGNSGGPVFSATTGRVIGIVSARKRDTSGDRYIALPDNYSSGFSLGGVDPVKFNVELYNKTVDLVGDVSQVGIGVVFSTDPLLNLGY